MEYELTEDELRFLARHGLGPDDVFDARRLPQRYWMRRIKEENKTVALGSPCRKAQHRLRSRKGHCIQCDTKKLAFQARYTADQYVYIAGSVSEELLKIGTCSHIGQREKQLRSEKYGSAGDWQVVYSVKVRGAGEIEDATLARLSRYRVARPYWKDGFQQMATELLQCPFSRAFNAVNEAAGDSKLAEPWKYRYSGIYEFSEPEQC
jgi:hypothetical protein